LAAASEVELEECLRPIGIQRRRAAALKALADNLLADPRRPREDWVGVGQYISRAIAVGVENAPTAMVDTNFVRVVRRAFQGDWMSDYRYDVRLQALALAIVRGGRDARSVNWAVLDLGARFCKPGVPDCDGCPIQPFCLTGRMSSAAKVALAD
jgi:adenine-specific DNA glycosylase